MTEKKHLYKVKSYYNYKPKSITIKNQNVLQFKTRMYYNLKQECITITTQNLLKLLLPPSPQKNHTI